MDKGLPCAFFDGAEQRSVCGCGVHIIMDKDLQFYISWNGAMGTNSLAEARALAGLLAFSIFCDIQAISIFGDSKSVVDHVLGSCLIKSPHLAGSMDQIMYFWGLIKDKSIQHICCSQNQQADCLSKQGLLLDVSTWSLKIEDGENSCFIQDFSIPGL